MWILSKAYVNWLYSQEPEAGFSADVCLIGLPSPQWSSTLTPRPSSSPDKTTGPSRLSLFGTMSALLKVARGAEKSTLFPAASPVRTSPPQVKAQESPAPTPASGPSSRASFARFDRATLSWKTPQCSFLGVSDEFSRTWPKAGMMRRGSCSELTKSELRTCESEFGFSRRTPHSKRFLTPMASEGLRPTLTQETLAKHWRVKPKSNLSEQIAFETVYPTPRTKGLCGGSGSFDSLNRLRGSGSITETERRAMASGNGGALNPDWVEWLMGWPVGWTALGASETDKCPSAPRPHSESCTK